MADRSLVAAAARNNAEWCDVFCRTHGVHGSFTSERWHVPTRPPPYYPDAVTLRPRLTAERVLAGVAVGPGCSVKDSFADVDLDDAGFHALFRAEWIVIDPDDVRRTAGKHWVPLTTARELVEWEAALAVAPDAPSFFKRELLDDTDVALLGGYDADRIVAGAVANRSDAVIGVGNIFHTGGDLDSAWAAAASAAARVWGQLPIVAYDHGDDLAAAHRAGFKTIGELRVWIHV